MHRFNLISILLKAMLAALLALPAQSFAATQADNWCKEAEEHITDRSGNPVACASLAKKRCVLMNNYWCQKHSADPWRGTTKDNGKNGKRDKDGHAIFDSATWSARAIAMDLRSKYKRGLTTALDIANAHSPWCDTLGSHGVLTVNNIQYGRTCNDGRSKPPKNFSGLVCQAPEARTPTQSDCKAGCNCPPGIAETLVRGLDGIQINDDLRLFDSAGKPLPNLIIVIQNLAFQEQGIHVKSDLISKGLELLP